MKTTKLSESSIGNTFIQAVDNGQRHTAYIVTEQGGSIKYYDGFVNCINLADGSLCRLPDDTQVIVIRNLMI